MSSELNATGQFSELARRIDAAELQFQRQRGTFHFWHLLLASAVLFLLILVAAVYAHQRGFLHFGDQQVLSPPAVASAAKPAEAHSGEKKGGDFRDLLTILVPTFAVAVAFMVGAAGMRRLESYDEEFARARKERREDAADIRMQLESTQSRFSDQLKATLGAQVSDLVQQQAEGIKRLLQDQATEAQRKIEEATRSSRESAEASATLAAETAARLDQDYSLVRSVPSTAELMALPVIAVEKLEHEVEELFANGKDAIAVNLVDACLRNSERLFGEANDWFNVSAELGRRGQELLALRVCKTALVRCFRDENGSPVSSPALARQDLLAHAISYAVKVGEWLEAESLVRQAETIGRERWGWRLFTFVGDYLDALGDDDRYEQLNTDFAKFLPFEERAYAQPASRLHRLGKLADAEQLIRSGLDALGVRGQQLCGIYSALLLEQGRYQETIKIATLGLANLADAQPTTATYALVFRRAAAFDAILVSSLTSGGEIGNGVRAHLLRQALLGYKATMDFGEMAPSTYRRQATVRSRLLLSLFTDGSNMGDLLEEEGVSDNEA